MRRFFALIVFLAFLGAVALPGGVAQQSNLSWTTIEKDGVWWLQTPQRELFYSKGVNLVVGWDETPKSRENKAFYWKNFYPSHDQWCEAVKRLLADWGFNTLGAWSDDSPVLGLPLTVDLELGRKAEVHWFDPFDPKMEQITIEWARKLTAPYRDDPRLLGYFSDNEVGWWNSALFRWHIKQGWENHTKQVLWRLLHDHYAGDWSRLLADWVPDEGLHNFDDLKGAGAKLRLRPGGEGIHLVDRFTYLVAKRYYALMYQAIRKAHPGALILGDRLPLYYHQDAVLAIGDSVDVLSTNYNVDVPDGWVAPYFFEGLQRLTKKPVLVSEFFFAAHQNRSGNRNETADSDNPKPGHLMTVNTQAERARGTANTIQSFARFPNVLGAHWFQLYDEPMGGRNDGEDYNMGLIDTANRPYEELTQVFQELNPRLDAIHAAAGGSGSGRAGKSSRAEEVVKGEGGIYPLLRAAGPIDVADQSLLDWDKAPTRLLGFATESPYVPFGDVHLAWAPQGLYLASIANTYVDPEFLAYEGEFPLTDTYQIHLLVEVEGRLNHFAIHLVPQKDPRFADGFQVQPQLYRYVDGAPVQHLAAQGRVQRLEKSLPHMLTEAFFPAQELGLEELRTGMQMAVKVVAVSYYREFTMGWPDALLPSKGQVRGQMRPVTLQDH